MSRERKYQSGDFENYYPGRNELRGGLLNRDDRQRGFEVERNERRAQQHPDDERSGYTATHQGKGPRNYRRRDERILEDISDMMCDNAYLDASEIDVNVSNGDVILSGTVENRQSKRLAEDIVEAVSGVQNIENGLRVKKRGI